MKSADILNRGICSILFWMVNDWHRCSGDVTEGNVYCQYYGFVGKI